MITQILRRIALLAVALGVVWSSPVGIGTARADNIGGKFERCAQLIEFVAPTASDPGHLTLVGMGPGLFNDISDTTTHRFPFSPDLVISDTLKSRLQALAHGQRFTCLRMEGDGTPLITQLAIRDGARQCGTVTRDADGIFTIDDEPNFLHVELIAEAKDIVASNAFLRRFLSAGPSSPTCLVFHLASNGIARSITVDGRFGWCGPLVRSGDGLRVGAITLGDARTSTAELLPARVTRAGFLLATRETRACGAAELKASRFVNAQLNAEGAFCGPVREVDGRIRIGRDTIPNILDETGASDLRGAIGGSACLTVVIFDNSVRTTLKTTAPPSPTPSRSPTPTPTVEPTPSPSPRLTATPTPAAVPVVPADVTGTPTSSTGLPVGPFLIGLLAVVAVVVVGFLGLRRSRTRTMLSDPLPSAAAIPEQAADVVVTQPSVIQLTRREQEVLAMLYDGLSNKEIGSRLFISESTAGVHVSNIMAKLGARSRAEAATLALRMHLLTNDTFEH